MPATYSPGRPNDDPALALCAQLGAFLDEQQRVRHVRANKERALREAAPAQQETAERDLDAVERVVAHLDDRIETYFDAITTLRARTLEGAAAKLDLVLRRASSNGADVFPWPQIRSVQRDLEQMAVDRGAGSI
jgi:hypothetical protein